MLAKITHKLLILNLIFISLFFIAVNTGCVQKSYFYSANQMRNVMGEVYLNNDEIVQGLFTMNHSGMQGSKQFILVKNDTENKRIIPIQDIKYLSINNNDYYPKRLDEPSLFQKKRVLFVKRLSNITSKIHLFELDETTTDTHHDNQTNELNTKKYFISMPDEPYETINIEWNKIVPDFENKVSNLLSDCTTISQKIKNKQKGYFYSVLGYSQITKVGIWLKIIEEYNHCTQ